MTYLLFNLCVGFAACVQSLTGFAFALVLLGLTTALRLAPIGEAADVASVLVLLNVAVYFWIHPLTPQWRVVLPALPSSCVCVVIGLGLLNGLGGHAERWLSMTLGLTIMTYATVLLTSARVREAPSGRLSYVLAGALSGLLGGLFSAAGPPLVFHMYRQPLPIQVVQQSLMLATAVSSALRLMLVVGTGRLSGDALLLGLASAPVVLVVNWFLRRHPPRLDAMALRILAAVLMGLSGLLLTLRP